METNCSKWLSQQRRHSFPIDDSSATKSSRHKKEILGTCCTLFVFWCKRDLHLPRSKMYTVIDLISTEIVSEHEHHLLLLYVSADNFETDNEYTSIGHWQRLFRFNETGIQSLNVAIWDTSTILTISNSGLEQQRCFLIHHWANHEWMRLVGGRLSKQRVFRRLLTSTEEQQCGKEP